MRTIALVIQRLYNSNKLTKEDLALRVQKGTLTEAEYFEIVGEELIN